MAGGKSYRSDVLWCYALQSALFWVFYSCSELFQCNFPLLDWPKDDLRQKNGHQTSSFLCQCMVPITCQTSLKQGNRPLMEYIYYHSGRSGSWPSKNAHKNAKFRDAHLVAAVISRIRDPTSNLISVQVAVYQVAWTSSFTMQRWCSLTLEFDFVKFWGFSPRNNWDFVKNCKLSGLSATNNQQVALEEAKTTSKPTLSLQNQVAHLVIVTAVRRNLFHGCHWDVSKSSAAVKCCKLSWMLPIFFACMNLQKRLHV